MLNVILGNCDGVLKGKNVRKVKNKEGSFNQMNS